MYRSQLKEVARLKQACTPKPRHHFFWVGEGGPTHEQQVEALIASGRASPNDKFVGFRWKSREEK